MPIAQERWSRTYGSVTTEMPDIELPVSLVDIFFAYLYLFELKCAKMFFVLWSKFPFYIFIVFMQIILYVLSVISQRPVAISKVVNLSASCGFLLEKVFLEFSSPRLRSQHFTEDNSDPFYQVRINC